MHTILYIVVSEPILRMSFSGYSWKGYWNIHALISSYLKAIGLIVQATGERILGAKQTTVLHNLLHTTSAFIRTNKDICDREIYQQVSHQQIICTF